ncbi:hypothetical protein WHI96_07965 [Pseudonocardia tropica]|uniref:Uncharacterized protein n=1 Tax=Pseudonocardia tropica TaxID=681289 RepID=A0ABV1JV30_9PSEU
MATRTRKTAAQKAADETKDAEAAPSTAEQFPSLHGDVGAEIAQRTPGETVDQTLDQPETKPETAEVFRKTFVVAGQVGREHPMHADNARRVLDEAIQRGLHPTAEAELVDVEEIPEVRGGFTTRLTYTCEVVPAVVDHEANETVTAGAVAPENHTLGTDPVEG